MANKYVSVIPSGTNNYLTPAEKFNQPITDHIGQGIVGLLGNTSGVAPSTGNYAVNAQGSPNMTVAVSSGSAYVVATPSGGNQQTFAVTSDASENVTISANSTGGTRYDFVYLVLDATKLTAPAVTGTDVASFTVQRSTTQYVDSNGAPSNSLLLAEVTVSNGASSISNSNISDRRIVSNLTFNNGWNRFSVVPAYASSTTFTLTGDWTNVLSIGTKIWFKQSGSSKYFYVTATSYSTGTTTVTVTGGSDYTVANAAIYDAHYSQASSPAGFPHYFNYSPTITNVTEGNGSKVAKFSLNGKLMSYWGTFTFGSTSAMGGSSPTIALPINLNSSFLTTDNYDIGVAHIQDDGTAAYPAFLRADSSSALALVCWIASGTYTAHAGLSSTVPMTWTTNDSFSWNITYPIT